jgi:hypothetical protein
MTHYPRKEGWYARFDKSKKAKYNSSKGLKKPVSYLAAEIKEFEKKDKKCTTGIKV